MEISPDSIIYWNIYGPIHLNATIVFTWIVMAIMVIGSWIITRNLATGAELSRGQTDVRSYRWCTIQDQIQRSDSQQDPRRYLLFIGSLFLFIAVSNLLSIVPGYHPPTGSLVNHRRSGDLCVFCGADLRDLAAGFTGISSANILNPLRSCCLSTLSENSLAPWRWQCVCLETL
jgi:F-type H+-transporting ATPase subunit a